MRNNTRLGDVSLIVNLAAYHRSHPQCRVPSLPSFVAFVGADVAVRASRVLGPTFRPTTKAETSKQNVVHKSAMEDQSPANDN